jgi:hypothetical protein
VEEPAFSRYPSVISTGGLLSPERRNLLFAQPIKSALANRDAIALPSRRNSSFLAFARNDDFGKS